MIEAARAASSAGKRVWWVGLPAQRSYVFTRLTSGGYTALGFEFMSGQQLYYRLLTRAGRLEPILPSAAAVVRVGEALRSLSGELPSPGEAHLFVRAIAEAKRYGVGPHEYERLAKDPEQRRLAEVYGAYEALKDGWDYDDVRLAAVSLLEDGADLAEADLLIVDGLRELGPLDLRIYGALAKQTEVHVNLALAPPGVTQVTELTTSYPSEVERHVASNPVAEARWVMRSVKRDLFVGGYGPTDVAIISPAGRTAAVALLAEEYGIPIMNESPLPLAEERFGKRLLDLLELPEHPTPARLLAVPALAPLAGAALSAGVAGKAAVGRLAVELGLSGEWEAQLASLEAITDQLEWARELVTHQLSAGDDEPPMSFVESALGKAQEAARLGADAEGFRAWWAALLRDSRVRRESSAGVALLTPTLASGRRFRKAYLMSAVEGAYSSTEREDYFLPEEQRDATFTEVARQLNLPARFQGRWSSLEAELLTRAQVMVVTAPLADRSGPLVPDVALLGESPSDLPAVEAGSVLELGGDTSYHATAGRAQLPRLTVNRLRRYSDCPFRFWGEAVLNLRDQPDDNPPAWRRLLSELLEVPSGILTPARLRELRSGYPEAAEWLSEYEELLLKLTFQVELPGGPGGGPVTLHAAYSEPRAGKKERAYIYRFVTPGRLLDVPAAKALLRERWGEYYAAYWLLQRGSVQRVHLEVWPLFGEPVSLYPQGFMKAYSTPRNLEELVVKAAPAYLDGNIEPTPGYICRDCPVFDVCRVGERS